MISHYEVPTFLQTALPEMAEELAKKGAKTDLYNPLHAVQCLTEFSIRMANNRNLDMLKRCFAATERLYVRGNNGIRNAVEFMYVRSFSRLFCGTLSEPFKAKILAIIPLQLYSTYVQQVLKPRVKNEEHRLSL